LRIVHVVGARPNFMKVGPVLRALALHRMVDQRLIHTGQHYDVNMSDVFFRELEIPAPDINLAVGSGTHATQTSEIMTRIEPVLAKARPDLVLVYGDVNSTLSTALVCAKLGIKLGHVEAGLRSFDRTMPEEINRLVTDQLSDFLFTPSEDGDINLTREGVDTSKIFRVGNVMIDSLIRLLPFAADRVKPAVPERYALVTMHRPANVDDLGALREILESLVELSRDLTIIFPVHPRTRERIAECNTSLAGIELLGPLPYIDFLGLQSRATLVITDSGGIQEESTYLGIPCITLRENTERPVTISKGTNVLVGRDRDKLRAEVQQVLNRGSKRATVPPLWDGHAGERIAAILTDPRVSQMSPASSCCA
jgi:UDP-N-acetylglucosamine 2-epimerase (non-hydrolysing)